MNITTEILILFHIQNKNYLRYFFHVQQFHFVCDERRKENKTDKKTAALTNFEIFFCQRARAIKDPCFKLKLVRKCGLIS